MYNITCSSFQEYDAPVVRGYLDKSKVLYLKNLQLQLKSKLSNAAFCSEIDLFC